MVRDSLIIETCREATVRAAKHLVIALTAFMALSGSMTNSAYAAHVHGKHHKGKYSPYKIGKNVDMFGGKYKSPKKQKLPKHSYKAH